MRFVFEVTAPSLSDLFADCATSLERVGSVEVVQSQPSRLAPPADADGWLTASYAERQSSRYVCVAKRQVSRHLLALLVHRLHELALAHRSRPLLVSEYINDAAAELLRQNGISYVDSAGNAHLVDPPLYVWLRGFRPSRRRPRASRAFQIAGLKLIALLLCDPDAVNWPYRRLSETTGLSLGSVAEILSDLRRQGFIGLIGPRRNSLANRRTLFEQWEFGYVERLRAALKPQLYRTVDSAPMDDLRARLGALPQADVLIGGELAASLVVGHMRPAGVTLHVRPDQLHLPLVKTLRLVPDEAGNVVLLEQFGRFESWEWRQAGPLKLIRPLLIHAELLSEAPDDRLRETASLIHDEYLEPELKNER